MSETINTQPNYYTKDFKGYHQTEDNFVANQELTVTITLNEYRKLIGDSAKSKERIEQAERNKYSIEEENRKLKEEVSRLKGLLYEKSISEQSSVEDGEE